MRVHGAVAAARVMALQDEHGRYTGTEPIYRWVIADRLPFHIEAMDEYTLDLCVTLPDGLTLVFDTT